MIELCHVFLKKAVRCTIHQRRAWFVGILDSTLARTFVPLALPISQLLRVMAEIEMRANGLCTTQLCFHERETFTFSKNKKN
jgi:hypothetical protein